MPEESTLSEWKAMRRESFVEYLSQDGIFDTSTENLALVHVIVERLLDDLQARYTMEEFYEIVNDDSELMNKYILFLKRVLETGSFSQVG